MNAQETTIFDLEMAVHVLGKQLDENAATIRRLNSRIAELEAQLAAVPVGAITYVAAEIVPVDEGDREQLRRAKVAIDPWLEAIDPTPTDE